MGSAGGESSHAYIGGTRITTFRRRVTVFSAVFINAVRRVGYSKGGRYFSSLITGSRGYE